MLSELVEIDGAEESLLYPSTVRKIFLTAVIVMVLAMFYYLSMVTKKVKEEEA